VKILLALSICFLSISNGNGQNESYIIMSNEHGNFLVKRSDAVSIELPKNNCYETIGEHTITVENNFILIELLSEGNRAGTLIFDKTGKQVDYSKVQEERKKHYQPFNCCVYVREYNGLLLFWDIKNAADHNKDYDCSYDSQTDASDFLIPRYYIFDPKTLNVVTRKLSGKCFRLIVDGKIACE
jgi:hypothetical protein